MKSAAWFLAKFALVSAVLLMLWAPLGRGYAELLAPVANAAYRLVGHHARYVSDHRGPHILYPDVFPPYRGKGDIRIPVLQRIAVDYNLIVLIALFAATPDLSRQVRTKGIAAGVLILSLLHVAHIYFISHLFIWDYIDFQRWPEGIPDDILQGLVENARAQFPRAVQPWMRGLHDYWNHFLREGAPLLVWLYFAYPVLREKVRRKHPKG